MIFMGNTITYLEILDQLKGLKREIKYNGVKLNYGVSYERKVDVDYGGHYEKLILNVFDPDIPNKKGVILREGYDVLDKVVDVKNVDDALEDLIQLCEIELEEYINGKIIKDKFKNIKSKFSQ